MDAASQTYEVFKKKEGSKNIASENCLRGIIRWVRKKRPQNILEIGTGIGTIPFSLKLAKERGEITHEFAYFGVEPNEYCIGAFKKNIPGWKGFVSHIPTISSLMPGQKFDFIIVDGRDKEFNEVLNLLEFNGTILVEGGRNSQQDVINELAGAQNRKFLRSNGIAFTFGHLGGYTVYFFDPTLADYLRHLKNKTATFFKWRLIRLIARFS